MKKNMLLLTAMLTVSTLAFAKDSKPSEEVLKKREAVKIACSQDIATTKCDDKEMGKGLLKCFTKYRRNNKGFKVSQDCKVAMRELKVIKYKSQ